MASENSSITPAGSGGFGIPGASLNTAFSLLGGAVTDLFGAKAGATSAAGDRIEAQGYRTGEANARDNATFAQTTEQVQEFQQNRANYQALSHTESQVGGAGFAEGGSALDILADSRKQADLSRSMVSQQGSINVAGFQEQASALELQAQAADKAAEALTQQSKVSKWSGIVKGVLGIGEAALSFPKI